MIQEILIQISPEEALDEKKIKQAAAACLSVKPHEIDSIDILKRSIDARSRQIKFQLKLRVYTQGAVRDTSPFEPGLRNVSLAPEIVIVGAGPAGLFAALKLISLGFKPVVIERGKDVRSRRRDLAAMNKEGVVNPESNYCFGEGGAGTYSDGKLYTRSTKRGNIDYVLHMFTYFGAQSSILYDAHPHIGTNKLPQIITAMRQQIIDCGGAVHFEKKLVDIVLDGNRIKGVKLAGGETIKCDKVILATGHSARDIFHLLHEKKILVESKPFALGVRIEHPQALIDSIQYHCALRSEYLPPASYSLVSQETGRGVFSFCMCPGGIIAPASTAPGEIVVNGWSPSKRNNPYANSGTVVAVNELDFSRYGFSGPLAAMQYQQMAEQKAYQAGGGSLVAPAQRLADFVNNKLSATLPDCSYLPGIKSVPLKEVLPQEVAIALKAAVRTFGNKMKGYFTNDAVMVATESRTSSPVRIPRDKTSLEHPQIKGLYPCGEGAGYAGGIVSAAIDGIKCAEAATGNLLLDPHG